MDDKLDSPICALRWDAPSIHLHTGKVKTCCRTPLIDIESDDLRHGPNALFNNSYFLARRKEMREGIRHSSCGYCWESERGGFNTPQLGLNHFLGYRKTHYQENPSDIMNDLRAGRHPESSLYASKPMTLEISVGSSCDLKCLYCCSEFSTRWRQEDRAFGEDDPSRWVKRPQIEIDKIQNLFWQWLEETAIHSLEDIYLIGGEPLLINGVDVLIARIASHAKKYRDPKNKLKLNITSNFNAPPDKFDCFVESIRHSAESIDIQLLASIESFGLRAEYSRYGLNWGRFTRNLATLNHEQNISFTVGLACTHNALSVSSLPELIEFIIGMCKKNNGLIRLHHNMVVFPSWLSVDTLPQNFSHFLDAAIHLVEGYATPLTNPFYKKSWFAYAEQLRKVSAQVARNNPSSEKINLFWNQIKKYDARRNTNFLEVFPEFRPFAPCEFLGHGRPHQQG